LFISSQASLCPIATKKGDKATNRRMQDIDKKTKPLRRCKIKPTRYNFIDHRVFGSVVVVAFQIAFRAEIHANDVVSFFKNYF